MIILEDVLFFMKKKTIYYIIFVLVLFPISFVSQLKINEVSVHKGFTDEFQVENDWIEIINTGTSPINLNNFYLSDKTSDLDKWRFPNFQIASNEKILVFASNKNPNYYPSHWENIVKANDVWNYVAGSSNISIDWNTLGFDDQSWNSGQGGIGYGDNDDNTIISSNTISLYMRKKFNIQNLNDLSHLLFHADYDDGFIAYLNGIEIMRSNNFSTYFPTFNTTTNNNHEAVLYNGGIPESKLLSLENFSDLLLQGDNVLAVQVHNSAFNSSDLSSNFFLSAGIISNNINYQNLPNWLTPPIVNFHCNFKLSIDETLLISNAAGTILDSLSIPNDLQNGLSYGRSPDGSNNWCFFNQPTPKNDNSNSWCYDGIEPQPIITKASGWYTNLVVVDVNQNPNSITRFTTNGDVPESTDLLFNSSVSFNNSSVLSVRAFSTNNNLPSEVVDRTFIINEQNHNLPVFSIITNNDNLWDWNNGLYVFGPNADLNNYPYFGSNFWEPWSKWSRMEFFDANQNKQFETQFDLEIHGGWSRAEPQKSFRIDTKSIYKGPIEYPLIPGKSNLTKFNNFNLRNGGQHGRNDRIQDAIVSRVVKETHIDRMAYEPAIVYLNGDYWGLYGIREKIDEHYVESNHGMNSDQIDLLNRDSALAGSSSHFMETFTMLNNTSISDSNFIDVFSSRFDIDNYIDYFITQTYIQNMDWMGIAWGLNNVKLWRPDTTGGVWRYVLYDTDGSLGYFGQSIWDNYINAARYPTVTSEHSQIFSRALNNQEFKCKFTNRYNDLINTIFQTNNFNGVATELKDRLSNAIPNHISAWSPNGSNLDSYSQWSNAINSITSYNTSRISTARTHLNQSLTLSGQKDVELNVMPSNSGKINISTITPKDYPWNGVYHGGCPINIQAIADSGYVFSHWDNNNIINSNNLNNEILESIELDGDYIFTANFTTCDESIEVSINDSTDNFITPTITGSNGQINYQWFANGQPISNDSIIYNPSNGVYKLYITIGSCQILSNLLEFQKNDYNLEIYPNPAENEFELIFLLSSREDIQISILNSLGQEISNQIIEDFIGQYKKRIDVSNLSKGAYFIQLKTTDKVYNKKLILSK